MILPTIAQENKEMTDKLSKLPQKVTDLTYDELCKANEIYWGSKILREVTSMMEDLKSGYIPNKFEKQAVEDFMSYYNDTFNSPLAKALEEDG